MLFLCRCLTADYYCLDGPAPAASAQPAQPDTFFDAFVSPTPAPAAAASFDPFAVQAHSSVPLQGGSHGAQFNMQGQQYPPQSNPQYQMPSYAPQPAYAVSGASYAAPAPAIPQQHYAQQAPRSEPAIEAQDFGDFESAKPVAPVAKNKKTNDWSNLVNLDNMSKAEPANGNGQAKKNDGFQDSFQGLDGFKRPQQHSVILCVLNTFLLKLTYRLISSDLELHYHPWATPLQWEMP